MSFNTMTEMFSRAQCEFDNLAKSAATISLHNFQWDYVTYVLYTSSLFCGVSTFIQIYGKCVIIGNRLLTPTFPENTSQFVVFTMDLDDIHEVLKWIKHYQIVNTGKYVIVCQSDNNVMCNESDAVTLFWQYKVTNVVFINSMTPDTTSGYTYLYANNCINSPPVELFNWNHSLVENDINITDIFENKFKNLNRCPIIISTFIQKPYMNIKDNVPSGADGDYLRIISEALNASLMMITPRKGTGWGYADSNGTWLGSLGDIYYDWANVSMTSASITLSRFETFQMSTNYYTVITVFVSHPATAEPASMKLLRPLEMNTRIAFIISLIVTFLLVAFLRKNCFSTIHGRHFGQFLDSLMFRCWEMCMGQPVTRIPRKMALLYLVLFWIWYCFLIRTFYQVYLIDSLKSDIYTRGFHNIDEAIKEGYPYGGGIALREYFADYPNVYANWINIESHEIYETLTDISNGKKFILAMNLATAQIYVKETKMQVHVLPEKITSSHSVLFFKKYSPLVESINYIITRLFECGWPQKIYKNNTIQKFKMKPENNNKPIELQHFTGCYVIIVIGWLMSLCSFVIELSSGKK